MELIMTRSREPRPDQAFSKRAKPSSPAASQGESSRPPRPARKLDADAAPEGYDANVWQLAVDFEAKAEAEGWQLAAGRPVIYLALERRLVKQGWLSSGRIREVHLDLTRDLMDDFFRHEIEWGRARYAHEQFANMLPEMAASFIEEVRIARLKGSGHVSELTPEAIERGQRVRAERAAEAEREAALMPDHTDRPAPPDWDAVKAKVAAWRKKNGERS